jgi:hypothetical protein
MIPCHGKMAHISHRGGSLHVQHGNCSERPKRGVLPLTFRRRAKDPIRKTLIKLNAGTSLMTAPKLQVN